MRWIRYVFWKGVFQLPVALVYWVIAADGLRTALPTAFAVKLHKLPLPMASLLADDEFGHKLDVAAVLSVVMAVGVCLVWERLLTAVIFTDAALAAAEPNAHAGRKRLVLLLLGPALLLADAALFYLGVQKHTSWAAAGAGTALPALMATLLYVTLIVTAAFVTAEAAHS